MHCLNFSIRHRSTPLHFCFYSMDDAAGALREFSENVATADDDELIIVRGEAGFLKRSFVAVELGIFADDDDNDDKDAPVEGPVPSKARKKGKQKRASPKSAKSDLEKSLKAIVESAQGVAAS